MAQKKWPLPVDLPGLDEDLRNKAEERIAEFERDHQADVVSGGDGWIPKIKKRDYAIAITLNLIVIIWLIIALV